MKKIFFLFLNICCLRIYAQEQKLDQYDKIKIENIKSRKSNIEQKIKIYEGRITKDNVVIANTNTSQKNRNNQESKIIKLESKINALIIKDTNLNTKITIISNDRILQKVKLSFGGFSSIGHYLQNKTYEWQKIPNSNNTANNSSNYLLSESGYTPFPIGLSAMANLEWQRKTSSVGLGLSTGLGLTLQFPYQLAYLYGGSLFFGNQGKSNHQLVITLGLAEMLVNKLNNNQNVVSTQQITYTTPQNIESYQEVKTGIFVSITYTIL